MQSWKQYYAEHTKGKKFQKGEIQAHMRKLAADYKKMKGGDGLSLKGGNLDEAREAAKEEVKQRQETYVPPSKRPSKIKGAGMMGDAPAGVPEVMCHEGGKGKKKGGRVKKQKTMEEQVKEPMPLPAFLKNRRLKKTEISTDKEIPKEEKKEEEKEEVEVEDKPVKKTRRIDFSKIHWGAFTDDWQRSGGKRKFKTLEDFAQAVLKSPKSFEPMVVKRARFYKNIIKKGKGLSML